MIRCRVCNREITNELSLKRGIGKKCYAKWKKGYRGIQLEPGDNVRELAEKLARMRNSKDNKSNEYE